MYDTFNELKQYYWDLDPTPHGFKSFFSALRILDKKGLIVTHSKFDQRRGYPVILDYKYLDRLKSEFEYDYKVEVKKPPNSNKSKPVKSDFTNSLKMKLTINDYQNHPDSPLYAGKVIFKEKIVIDPDIEYVFGQWERKNDELYFTLVPAHELDKLPVQKKLSHEPKAVQEHITDFLNNITIDK
jgi:hypothetical protein